MIYNVWAHTVKSKTNNVLFCLMVVFQPSNCNTVSLKENFRRHWMMWWAPTLFSGLPGGWDLLISVLHYLHWVFTFFCKSKALCFFQSSLRTWLCNTVFIFLYSHLQFLFDLGPRCNTCAFILIIFLQYLAFFQLHIFLCFFWPLLHAATPSFNFHSSSSTPKYFLSLNLCKTSL